MKLVFFQQWCRDSSGSRGPPPLLKLVKNGGHHAAPQVSQVTGPPSDKFLDPLLCARLTGERSRSGLFYFIAFS